MCVWGPGGCGTVATKYMLPDNGFIQFFLVTILKYTGEEIVIPNYQ